MPLTERCRASLPRAGGATLAGAGLAAILVTHAAVITKRLPYTSVTGGRVADPHLARQIAVGSVIAQLPVVVLVIRAAQGAASQREQQALAVLAAGAALSVPLQLVGTTFERLVMAPAAAALALGAARLTASR